MKPMLSKVDLAQPERRLIKLSRAKVAERTRKTVRDTLALSAGYGWRVPVHVERDELHWTETLKDNKAVVPESEMPTTPGELHAWIRDYAAGDDREVTEAELRARIMLLELTEYLPRVGATMVELATAFTRDLTSVIGKLEREAGMRRRGRPREYRLEPADVAAIVSYTRLVALMDCSRMDTDDYAELAVYIEDGPDAGTWQTEAHYAKGDSNRKSSPLSRLILSIAPHLAARGKLDEVKLHLGQYVPVIRLCDDPGIIACENCLVDIRDPERIVTRPFTPDLVFACKAAAYDPSAPSPVRTLRDGSQWTLDNWFEELAEVPDDPDETAARRPLYRQILAKAVDPNLPAHVMVCMYDGGVGSTGKGTVIALVRSVAGRKSFNTTFRNICSDFGLEGLDTSPLVVFEEVPTNVFETPPEVLKQLIDGTPLMINRKHRSPVQAQWQGLSLACFNELPRVADKTESFTRRLVFRRFIKSYNPDHEDDVEDTRVRVTFAKDPEIVAYATRMGVEAAHEWLHSSDCDHFAVTKGDAATKIEFRRANDPVFDFVQTELGGLGEFVDSRVTGICTEALYKLYCEWYRRNVHAGGYSSRLKFLRSIAPMLQSVGWEAWFDRQWRTGMDDATDFDWSFDRQQNKRVPTLFFERCVRPRIRGIRRASRGGE